MTAARDRARRSHHVASWVVAAGVAALVLSGCSVRVVDEAAPESSAAATPSASTPSAVPSAEGGAEGGAEEEVPSAFPFNTTEALPAGYTLQWGDTLIADSDWAVSSPDNGQGSWAYTTTDGACTASFFQGRLGQTGDDIELSDTLLATATGYSPSEIASATTDGSISYQVTGNDGIAARYLAGGTETRWIRALSRAISSSDAALFMSMTCDGRATTEWDDLIARTMAVALPTF